MEGDRGGGEGSTQVWGCLSYNSLVEEDDIRRGKGRRGNGKGGKGNKGGKGKGGLGEGSSYFLGWEVS